MQVGGEADMQGMNKIECASCGKLFEVKTKDDENTRGWKCKKCFFEGLRERERPILENYVLFGSQARWQTAKILLDRYGKTRSARRRRLIEARIFEQYVAATEDLIMLYNALKLRKKQPVLYTLLSFQVKPEEATRFYKEVNAQSPSELLQSLGLAPLDSFPSHNAEQVKKVYKGIVKGLKAASARRNELVYKTYNKIKHGFIATETLGAQADSEAVAGDVIVFWHDRLKGKGEEVYRLQEARLIRDVEHLPKLVDTIRAFRNTVINLISGHLYSVDQC